MSNPFRLDEKRELFESVLEEYRVRQHGNYLFNEFGERNTERWPGGYFWIGYDDVTTGLDWNFGMNKTRLEYIFYRAGQEAKKSEL